MICERPSFCSSITYFARRMTLPRFPVRYASRNAEPAADGGGGGEVGRGDEFHQLVERDVRVVDQGDGGVADLAQVVRRDARGHADGDAARAIDEQVGELPGQDPGLHVLLVVARLEVDGVELDVLEHLGGNVAQLRLGVPHGRRG